ncbi:hypothetical protein ADN00_14765 [Ornatilinea apprima]|uniref:EamA domain-containing protein n=1 Tax=Ornatilinea apprima TaxID=1134406 RepID=A0A0P6X2I0_9CHLR|nr:DMT family transporter [Ornatilinea apprima]KPL73598.1 hypothetical protein ADN00_14765 [Ornatilinea apprima]
MMIKRTSRTAAVALAFFVTFLWSTSWVLIKIGLLEIPPLLFAGLRYALAFAALLLVSLLSGQAAREWKGLTRREWGRLAVLGLVFYALTQGSSVMAQKYLPSASVSLMLNFTTPLVACLGIFWLNERLTRRQWLGITIFLAGGLLYFLPLETHSALPLGWAAAGVAVGGNTLAAVLGRSVNREQSLSPLSVTTLSMGVGALALLAAGAVWETLPAIRWQNWVIIAWLALVNGALAFTLWNHTQRHLAAAESSLINNTMLIQITLLTWLFLGEAVTTKEALGLGLAVLGMVVMQARVARRLEPPAPLVDDKEEGGGL